MMSVHEHETAVVCKHARVMPIVLTTETTSVAGIRTVLGALPIDK